MKKNIYVLAILAVILAGCGGVIHKGADAKALGPGAAREDIQDERQMDQLKETEE